MRTTVILVVYAILVTVFAGTRLYESDRVEEEFENIIFQQEKLLLEMEEGILVSCSTELEERPYTFDQWVTEKPCPEGKHGPLCHMNTGPEEQ